MCGRFTRFHTWADIHGMYRLLPATETGRNTEARYNIASTEDVYFVTAGEDGSRREAKVLLGQVARGGNPAEDRKLDREAITVKELCTRYLEDLRNGLVLGKGGRPKKATTISTDLGRIERTSSHCLAIEEYGIWPSQT